MREKVTDKNRITYPWMEEYRPEFKPSQVKMRSREGLVLFLLLIPVILLFLIGLNKPELFFITITIISFYLLFLMLYFLCGVLLPIIWILIKVALRTKNRNFVFQSVFYVQYFTLLLFIATAFLAPLDLIFGVYFNLTNQLSIPDEIAGPLPFYAIGGYLAIFLLSWGSIKQPLFLDNYNRVALKASTILSSQALDITSEQDGYSQRDLYIKFDVLSKIIRNS